MTQNSTGVVLLAGAALIATVGLIAAATSGPDVEVSAPAAQVDTSRDGTQVDTPFAKVETEDGRTKVKAPFVDIDVPSDKKTD